MRLALVVLVVLGVVGSVVLAFVMAVRFAGDLYRPPRWWLRLRTRR